MSILEIYQYIPEHIDPIVFSIGFFSLRWYSVMYLTGFTVVYLLLRWRISHGEEKKLKLEDVESILLYCFSGLIIGARIGYVLFYDLQYFLDKPLAIISPYDFSNGQFRGIFGMSYFGGLIGVVVASVIFSIKRKIGFLRLADFVIPAIPAGYFFGRIGNFLNGELYGRATEKVWGMYFSSDVLGIPRHPSQLYEAFFEGAVLFSILWIIRNKQKFSGQLLVVYLFGYGTFRFFIEFFREPDPQSGLLFNFMTLGQIFSLLLIISGPILYWKFSKKRKSDMLP